MTATDQLGTFWISSTTRTTGACVSRARFLACCHSVCSQEAEGTMASSALTKWFVTADFFKAWAIMVLLPVWRGPTTTWISGLSRSVILDAMRST